MCKRYLLYLKEKKNIANKINVSKIPELFRRDEFYYTIRKEAFITFKNLPLKGERENTLRKKKTPNPLHTREHK